MNTYIALDLETTGFDGKKDQVIEIAAIKFRGNEVIETFETLVNPEIPVPAIITHITGIREEELKHAPLFVEIAEKLKNFLGEYPIIGHNINFDIDFLNQKKLDLKNPLFDTLQLTGILLPGLASYSLDTLSRVLKIEHKNKHRAMSDANACLLIFRKMIEKLAEIDDKTMEQIRKVLEKSTWDLKKIFLTKKPKEIETPSVPLIPIIPNFSPPLTSSNTHNITEAEWANFFDQNGVVSKVIKEFEARDSQKKMATLILDAFKAESNLIVEAGTGTGKTLAYLASALKFGLENKQKIIISTYTRNLQEQIIDKDIPKLQKIFAQLSTPVSFTAVPLKGRRNYISLKRFENLLRQDQFQDYETTAIIKILIWLTYSQSGDLDELVFQGKEVSVIDEICCMEYICDHEDHEYKSSCYLIKAREKAEKADLVIINHALLMQDMVWENKFLPEYNYLVVDEAHHLERVATESLTINLSFNQFIKPFDRSLKKLEELVSFSSNLFTDKEYSNYLHSAILNIKQLISKIDIFFGLMGIFMEKNTGLTEFQPMLTLLDQYLESNDWKKVSDSARSTIGLSLILLALLRKITEKSESIPPPQIKELENYLHECTNKITDLQHVFASEKQHTRINWLFKTFEASVTLKNAPASIGKEINDLLFSRKKGIILTSATLRTDKTFNFIRSQLELGENFGDAALPSHFAYPDQVKILIPDDLPEPNSEGYFLNCANLIEEIILKNGGRTLVLFTAKRSLSATYNLLAPKLKEKGLTILGQGISGGRGKIIEHFKDEPEKCAIFGTSSFWEGVDIRGDDLTCVIMQKLPFDPPEDPIILARGRMFADSFTDFQLPRAILKFKQGFGRLIRSSSDTGTIVVLDTRITQKSYGRKFLEALPEGIKIKYGTKSSLASLL